MKWAHLVDCFVEFCCCCYCCSPMESLIWYFLFICGCCCCCCCACVCFFLLLIDMKLGLWSVANRLFIINGHNNNDNLDAIHLCEIRMTHKSNGGTTCCAAVKIPFNFEHESYLWFPVMTAEEPTHTRTLISRASQSVDRSENWSNWSPCGERSIFSKHFMDVQNTSNFVAFEMRFVAATSQLSPANNEVYFELKSLMCVLDALGAQI